MRIHNDGIAVEADYDVGISLIESLRHQQARIEMPKFAARFEYRGRRLEFTIDRPDAVQADGNRISIIFSHKIEGLANKRVEVNLNLNTYNDYDGLIVSATLANFTDETIFADHIRLLDLRREKGGSLTLGHGVTEWSFFKQGFQSFSATGTLRVDKKGWRPRFKFLRLMEENITNKASRKAGNFVSEWVTQITNCTSGHVLLAGFIEGATTLGDVALKVTHKKARFDHLIARAHFDGFPLSPGESIQSDPLLIRFGSRNASLLPAWADIVGKRMNARVPQTAPGGWCSWYYYYTKIDEDQVLANLSQLDEQKKKLNIHYLQVDDGYQAKIGDWLENHPKKFPSGMEEMARRIQSAGLVPGIWTAPFYARPNSNLFKNHRDWFLVDHRGKLVSGGWNPLWGGKVYCLDPTHPGTQGYLRQVYTTLRSWGYRVFKCDFLYAAALPGARHLPHTTRAQALRIGLSIIRESIGNDSFLLGCGCPILPAVGIMDGMRISMDVAPFWNNRIMGGLLDDKNALCTRHAILNTLNRAFMHNRLFVNDPDCLMVRKDRNRLSRDQVEALASTVALSGGMFVISDNMETLDEDRREILQKTIHYRAKEAEVVDPHVKFEPEVVVGQTSRGVLIGLYNFSKKSSAKIFDLKELMSMKALSSVSEIRDVWSGRELQHQNGLLRVGTMGPDSVRLIELTITEKGWGE